MTMAALARELPQDAGKYVDKRVVDLTGLQGAWDFTVRYVAHGATGIERGPDSVYNALQAQVGLQLESRKVPVPVVVIDSMDRAPGN